MHIVSQEICEVVHGILANKHSNDHDGNGHELSNRAIAKAEGAEDDNRKQDQKVNEHRYAPSFAFTIS